MGSEIRRTQVTDYYVDSERFQNGCTEPGTVIASGVRGIQGTLKEAINRTGELE